MNQPRKASALCALVLVLASAACARASTLTTPDHPTTRLAAEPRVDPERMFSVLEHLANDALEGRYSLSESHIRAAATYLADAYRAAGIAPVGADYLLDFPLPAGTERGDDYHFWVEHEGANTAISDDDFVTLGTSEARGVVADVVVLEPSKLHRMAKGLDGKVALLWFPSGESVVVEQLAAVVQAKATGVIVVQDALPPKDPSFIDGFVAIALTRSKARQVFELDASGRASSAKRSKVSLAPKPRETFKPVPNVLASIPGSSQPSEIVVLGAHYDHIGTAAHGVFCRPSPGEADDDSICNGADDNASGTAMVLEIARAFASAAYRPSRTIVFAHFAGEELGLHGSRALANDPPNLPPFRGGKVVAMINLDMVGRLGEKGLSIGGIGSSSTWMDILNEVDERGLSVVYERAISGRSDHAPFYEKQVPILFFFTGVHADYHRAGDEAAKINLEGMTSIAHMVTDTLRKVADGHPIAFTPPRSPNEGLVSRMPGTDPTTIEQRGLSSE